MHRIAIGILLACTVLFSQTTPAKKKTMAAHHGHKVTAPDSLKWMPPPPEAVQGQPPADLPSMRSQIAVIDGDPTKPGLPFVIRIKSPDGEVVPPHWHPTDEHVTVLQGTFILADGEKYSESGGAALNAGAYVSIPKRMWHYGRVKGDTILQIHGIGPFVINFGPLTAASAKPSGE